jgi:hypothetical protein
MAKETLIGQEFSLVVVGNFNPKIFHPEWYIRKKILPEWDYSAGESNSFFCQADFSQFEFDGCKLQVFLNQFVLRTTESKNREAIQDFAIRTFEILGETPVSQVGMNSTFIFKLDSKETYFSFGEGLAPSQLWAEAAGYVKDVAEERKKDLGVYDLTMQLPRPDDLSGYVRSRLHVQNVPDYVLNFSVNSHVELGDAASADTLRKILLDHWEPSLSLAETLYANIVKSQLG